jgi:hypothetical protein
MNLTANDLRGASAHRRRQSISGWTCHYCSKNFQNEKVFEKHNCRQKQRFALVKTIQGQAAYAFYAQWFKEKRQKVPPIDTFSASRYFLPFWNFAEMVKKVSIDRPNIYIRLMVMKEIDPVMWCRDQSYSYYLEFCERETEPYEAVNKGLEILERIQEVRQIKMKDIFKEIGFNALLELIRLRNISPWLLLNCDSFSQFYQELDSEQTRLLCGVISYEWWADRFETTDGKELRKDIKEILNDFGL